MFQRGVGRGAATNECEPLADLGLQVTPRHPQQEDTKAAGMDVKDVAFVRFVPSSKNPHPDFADELYFPPIDEESPQQPPAASDFAISNGALLFFKSFFLSTFIPIGKGRGC
jgi:hypothetical protein